MRRESPGAMPELPGASLTLIPAWLTSAAADRHLQALITEVEYSRHRVRLFGREHLSPRLSAWVGDEHATYRYSGTLHQPSAWTPSLSELRSRLNDELACTFNSVLINRYRDGNDSMGWHSDDEGELGPEPLIASVSLGATRSFRLRSREKGGPALALELGHGSLLLMGGATQQNYRHALPKTRKAVGERINLTFRQITPKR